MKKSEFVLLEALRGAGTQKQIAQKLEISLSTVNSALRPLAEMGAIEIRKFGFRVVDAEKALLHLAGMRRLGKDIVYRTRHDGNMAKIEALMPSGAVFTAYSAYRLRYREAPADYSEVYVYADEGSLAEIIRRFPQKGGPANVVVLKKDGPVGERLVNDWLLFADLWNLKEWYAREFLGALRRRMGLVVQ